MGSERNRRPHWNMLTLVLVLAVGGLALERTLHLTATDHTIVLILMVVVIYGLMGLWVKSNETALEDLDAEEYRKQSRESAAHGTPEYPTRSPSGLQETVSYYRHETLDRQNRQ